MAIKHTNPQDVLKKLREMKLGAHIDHTHSISIGRLGEMYYLMIVIDGIDFVWSQTCQVRTHPKDLLHEFLTMSRLKISTIRFDDARDSVRAPHSLLFTHNMILSVNLWLHIHIFKMREMRGRLEFAKITFGVFSSVLTCLVDSDLMSYVTSASSMPTGLWINFSPTSCVTIWSRTCMFLTRTSRVI